MSLHIIAVGGGIVGNQFFFLCDIAKFVILILVILHNLPVHGVLHPGDHGGGCVAAIARQEGIIRAHFGGEGFGGHTAKGIVGEIQGIPVGGHHRRESAVGDRIVGVTIIIVGLGSVVNETGDTVAEAFHPVAVVIYLLLHNNIIDFFLIQNT